MSTLDINVIKHVDEEITKYDPEMRFRVTSGIVMKIIFAMTIILSIFHIYTAGFGVLQEWRHRAFHLAFVLPLVFLLFSIRKKTCIDIPKHFVYDIVYGLIGTSLIYVMAKDILDLSFISGIAVAVISFFLIVYFKRRQFLLTNFTRYIDLPVFTCMLACILLMVGWSLFNIDFKYAFKGRSPALIIWSIFLLGSFASIIILMIIQWFYSVSNAVSKRPYYCMDNVPYFDVFFAFLSCLVSAYIFLEYNSLALRAGLSTKTDLIVGAFCVMLVLEGARRSLGAPLPLIAYAVLVNCYLGPYFLNIPGLEFFAHRGYSSVRILEHMFLGVEGIYGIPLGVVATFVFHFVLFGIFISKTGLGGLFMDLAMVVAGGSPGGPAKVSVISSGFLGSISGSSVANTVTTGAFTIPLMKKIGYSPQFAGAVEAAASTGGQIMPPIMGAAAFIMAEFLGIPYIKIAACAIIPAFLHFFAVGIMVHFEAMKRGFRGLPREELPKLRDVISERWIIILPLLIIIFFLISGASPFLAAFWSIIYAVVIGQIHKKTVTLMVPLFLSFPPILFNINPVFSPSWGILCLVFMIAGLWTASKKVDRKDWLWGILPVCVMFPLFVFEAVNPSNIGLFGLLTIILVGMFYEDSKMGLAQILETLELGTRNALAIGAACACVGFIVGATTLTGLGLKFASAIIHFADSFASFFIAMDFMNLLSLETLTLFFTLVFTAISCLLLGMGLPTTAQYIIASMIAAPVLLQFGINPLVSHMFVFFYAVLADVTPPVALAGYAAAGISGGDPFKTGIMAFTLSFSNLTVPFAFIFSPIILWMPKILDPSIPFDFIGFAISFISIVLAVISIGATFIGYLIEVLKPWERIITGIAGILFINASPHTSLIALTLFIAVYIIQRNRRKNLPVLNAS